MCNTPLYIYVLVVCLVTLQSQCMFFRYYKHPNYNVVHSSSFYQLHKIWDVCFFVAHVRWYAVVLCLQVEGHVRSFNPVREVVIV